MSQLPGQLLVSYGCQYKCWNIYAVLIKRFKMYEIALNTKFENKTKNFGKIFAEKKNNILIFRGITGLSHETYFLL